jgi:uncharacterized protein
MAGPAELFSEIHRLRGYARDLENSLESGPRRIKAQQTAVAKAEEELRQAQETVKKMKVAVHDRETSIKACQEQIKKYEKQLSDITSKKEYDALRVEIGNVREKIKSLEDEALTAMLEVDDKSALVPAFEEKVKKAKADFKEFEREFESKVATWTAERAKALKEIEEQERQLPPDISVQYERVVKAMGADSMASVEGRNCTACYTEITAQLYHNLLMKQVVLCRACGRYLYLKG